jgi:hypothetical protein
MSDTENLDPMVSEPRDQTYDVGDILTSIQNHQFDMNQIAVQEAAAYMQQRDLYNESLAASLRAGDLNGVITAADNSQALALEQRKQTVGAMFGVDVLDPNNQIAVLARQQDELHKALMAQQELITSTQTTHLFDDPMKAIIGRSMLGMEVQKLKGLEAQDKMVGARINELNQQAQSTLQTQKALNAEFSKEEAAAKLELQSLQAGEAARAIRMNQSKLTMSELERMRTMKGNEFKTELDRFKIIRDEQLHKENLKDKEELRKRQKEEADARVKKMQEELKAKATKEEQERVTLEAINLGASELGLGQFNSLNDMKLMSRGDKEQLAARGFRLMAEVKDKGTAVARFADTPGESYVQIADRRTGYRLPETAVRTQEFLLDIGKRATYSAQEKKILGKDPQGAIVNEIDLMLRDTSGAKGPDGKPLKGKEGKPVPGLLSRFQNNAEENVDGIKNIYKAPDPATLATAAPELTKTPFWEKVVIPAMNANKNPSGDEIFKQAALAVASEPSNQQFINFLGLHLSNYYSAMVKLNNETNMYPFVGLPTQDSYKVRINMPQSGSKQIDLTNEAAIYQALFQYRAELGRQTNRDEINQGLMGWN